MGAEDERFLEDRVKVLGEDALVVFVSDCHIGGDPGCDGFEAAEELTQLVEDISTHEGPVELVLAGDFLDLLLVGEPAAGKDRAGIILERPEYERLFEALRRFSRSKDRRIVYLPGNHDAEVWWNERARGSLEEGIGVDEFALSYLVGLRGRDGERYTVYCEHGDQFDPPNRVDDYSSPLSTPLGFHIVRDFERRIVPLGRISRNLDLSEMRDVRPLSAIPQWMSSKYFYNVLGSITGKLMLPFMLLYLFYRAAAFFSTVSDDAPRIFYKAYLLVPRVDAAIKDAVFFVSITLLLFAALVLLLGRTLRRFVSAMHEVNTDSGVGPSQEQRIDELVVQGRRPPMLDRDVPHIDAFVSGHTHTPDLRVLDRHDGRRTIVANSGCWLRWLTPIRAWLKGPPVFVPTFMLTHVRVFVRGTRLRVELWQHPKPTALQLTRLERLATFGKRPRQPAPGAKPRLLGAAETFADFGAVGRRVGEG
ncbi:MAG: metallophosphoesterase [Rubrobacteraceae bacterium]|nr:metallophosphoesterase [Rubrobacteraceae bacterium]MCL6438944.1 metallophosphoesterase [Rubrobacteraceae bacterium]